MKSKEDNILELFFNYPTREWHFEEILKETHLSRSKTAPWLKKLTEEKIIQRVKEKGKMPYYVGKHASPAYQQKKRLFSYKALYASGLLNHLASLKKIKTAIIFGSFSRSDWHKKSDIDLFLYGDPEGLHIAKYELSLHKDIQPFICKTSEEIEKLGEKLLKNIIKGNIIKGNIDFVEVKFHGGISY
ncbi:nucleotidyltransferase domain-containing protein [Candidatus Woesearchaeota archaeon]|nr:nucleotidyltransferase domain-containing protein [Candidatus Woesearchaeota archaeon]